MLKDNAMNEQDMKGKLVICSRCGHAQRFLLEQRQAAYMCGRCYADLPDPFSRMAAIAGWLRSHRALISIFFAGLAGAILGYRAYTSHVELERLKSRLETERMKAEAREAARSAAASERRRHASARQETDRETKVRLEFASPESGLQDKEVISGRKAQERHENEWNRRMAHDEAFARSPMEKTLLKIDTVGRDSRITAKEALQAVVQLVVPGSEAEVTSVGDKFDVKVAFKMSALTLGETGPWTKHRTAASIEREAVELCARVMRVLFDACGSRGIARMQVTCNKAVRQVSLREDATEEEKRRIVSEAPVVMAAIYRCSLTERKAAQVANWRTVPLRRVVELFDVEINRFAALTVTPESDDALPRVDPDNRLEF